MSQKASIQLMLGLLLAVIVFHGLLLLKVIPYTIAWGGHLKTDQQMYIFEAISICINLFLMFILLVKGSYINSAFWGKRITGILWGFLVIFILNTMGNLFAKTTFEKFFAFVTLLFAVLIANTLFKKEKQLNS